MSIHMRGYGGCLNPPCRQQPYALEAVFARVPALCTQPMFISRLADGFTNGLIANRSHAKRDRVLQQRIDDSGFVFYITSEESLTGETTANPLRFLIISEVPAMDCQNADGKNTAQACALLGFRGF